MTMIGRLVSMGLFLRRWCCCFCLWARAPFSAGFFHFLETGTHMSRHGATTDLQRKNRRGALHEGEHEYAQNVIVVMFIVRELCHVRRERPNHSVAQQNSQEGSYQGSCNFVADLFRRTA